MNLLESIHDGEMTGLGVLIYARPKTGKTAMFAYMDWSKTLLFDFDTDGHLTLTSIGIKPSVISFALLNVKILKDQLDAEFGPMTEIEWKNVSASLLEPFKSPRVSGSREDVANLYRYKMIKDKHIPFFVDGPDLMKGTSRFPVLDNLSQMVNSQIIDKYETIIADNISKLREMMIESCTQWNGKSLSDKQFWAVNKTLKSFDMSLLNIKNSGKTLVVVTWAENREITTSTGEVIHATLPDVGGKWAESYHGNFSLCLEARKDDHKEENGEIKPLYYVTANNRTVASRVYPLIGDECFLFVDKKTGEADRSKPFLRPDLNAILISIKKNKENLYA